VVLYFSPSVDANGQVSIQDIAIQDVVHPGYVAGNWYAPAPSTLGAGQATTTGAIRMIPFFLPRPITIQALAVRITTLVASGNVKVAIYTNNPATANPAGLPLAQTGDLTTAAAGTVSETLGTNVRLESGTYWMALQVDSTAGTGGVVLQTYPTSYAGSAFLTGGTLANISSAAATSAPTRTVAQAYGTFPDMTGASISQGAASNTCVVFLQAA